MKTMTRHSIALIWAILFIFFLIAAMAKLNSHAKAKEKNVEKKEVIALPLVKRKPKKQNRRRMNRSRQSAQKSASLLPALKIPSAVSIPELADLNGEGNDGVQDVNQLGVKPQLKQIFEADKVDTPPQTLSSPAPFYPSHAEQSGIEGEVIARILIDKEGRVKDVRIISATPKNIFDSAAIQALMQWRFTPAKMRKRIVSVWARQKLRFKLQ